MTEELLRMMRQQPVLVVWMFDASNSLKDDRAEIVANFHKIYDELRIAQDEPRSAQREVFSARDDGLQLCPGTEKAVAGADQRH